MSTAIDFYFDFYSPYAYLASYRIDQIGRQHGREVIWRPFMLGPAFAATGHQPLLSTPLMGDYVARDFARSARLLGVPFQLPEEFPKGALAQSRAFYWLHDQDPELAKALARRLFVVAFGEGRDATQPQLVADEAAALGVDPEALLEAIQQPQVKARLKQETEAAMTRGVFGSPFIFVDGEPFWGNDRLDQVDQWLATGGW